MTHTSAHKIRLGMISYWNLHPFRREVQRAKFADLEMVEAVPSILNRWLGDGTIHLAPCSSICLNAADYEMALPLGVASHGAVGSVYLGLSREHEPMLEALQARRKRIQEVFAFARASFGCDARKISSVVWKQLVEIPSEERIKPPAIKITKQSAASAMLTQILYKLWFGESLQSPHLSSMTASAYGGKPIELVIGDEALQRKNSFYRTLDLGSLWKEMTELPFVFAVWQSRGSMLNGWRRKIQDIGERAETLMHIEPNRYLPTMMPLDTAGKELPLVDYWRKIHYRLGPDEFMGLLVFLCLARHCQELPLDDALCVKILRWQEITETRQVPHL